MLPPPLEALHPPPPPVPSPLFLSLHARLARLQQAYEFGALPPLPLPDPDDSDLLAALEDCDRVAEAMAAVKLRLQDVRLLLNAEWRSVLHSAPRVFGGASLRVSESLIPGAGLGLFARAAVPAGATCCCMYGDVHSLSSHRSAPGDGAYAILLPLAAPPKIAPPLPEQGGDAILDCEGMPAFARVKARFANDPRSAADTNCRFVPELEYLRVRLVASRDIRAGEEVYVDYGEAYWARHEGGGPNTLRN